MKYYNSDFVLSESECKKIRNALVGYYGVVDFATGSPRETLKKASSCGIITEDAWIDMMNDRNLLAHDYDGEIAKNKIMTIIDVYIPTMEKLVARVTELYDGM